MEDLGRPVTGGDGSRGDGGATEAASAGVDAASRRPLIERLGLAAIATVLALFFGGVGLAAWYGGEVFLAVMAGLGALMTAWAGAITLTRG